MAGKYRGPLHGIPYGAKDLLATKGIPTTWGAPPFRDQVFDYDATVIRKLREAGAVLLAKLAMIELAGGGGYNNAKASLQGPSRCPFNLDYWAGGSSSGPGAAVPSALVGFAIGSETQGSIITPAAFSGVSGLRPTYGRVSRSGAMALSWTMDKLGPMCRSAVDCGIVLEAIAGHDPADPSTLVDSAFKWRFAGQPAARRGQATAAVWQPLKGKKLGLVQPDSSRGGNAEVAEAFKKALDVLRSLGAEIIETEMPDLPYGPVGGTLIAAEGATIFRPLVESGKVQELVDESQKIGLIASLEVRATDYLDACRIRAEIQHAVGKMFEKFDALVGPSRATPANRVDRDFGGAPPPTTPRPPQGERPPAGERPRTPADERQRPATPPAGAGNTRNLIGSSNVAGLPAISVPCGFTKENLPIGIQFIADAMREDVCLHLAASFQSVTDWHRRRPQL
jgi:aspartyl-tRNA(Asn)/glutamyl-tRNA(Gln) amidotransferase subunit A